MNTALSDDFIGVVWLWYGSTSSFPVGWIACDGTAFDQNKYPQLYGVIGLPNVPDLGGRVVIGAGTPLKASNTDGSNPNWNGNSSFVNNTLLGEFSHYLSEDEMPEHSHQVEFNEKWQGGPGNGPNLLLPGLDTNNLLFTDSSGSGLPHNNVQPALVMNYMIYAGPPVLNPSEQSNA